VAVWFKAAARLLGSRVRVMDIRRLGLLCVVKVAAFATGLSLVQSKPTGCLFVFV
jgi:hypothetical protein